MLTVFVAAGDSDDEDSSNDETNADEDECDNSEERSNNAFKLLEGD